tara:strand:- start:246 stop:896 length:651 start_codon:yes stop_codon:yes gene_type:complete
MKKFKIRNHSAMQNIEHLAEDLYSFAQKYLNFDKPAEIVFESQGSQQNSVFAPTANYSPHTHTVTVFVDHRHPKDILRSMAHELVHHTQCCRGEFNQSTKTHPGYAQENEHMRSMEEEAYYKGNVMLFRDWEDNYKKGKNIMNENKEKIDDKLPGDQEKLDVAEPKGELTKADFDALRKTKSVKKPEEKVKEQKVQLKDWYNNQIYDSLMKKFIKT